MGREVRRVPKDWQHPKESDGSFKPLYPGAWYEPAASEWLKQLVKFKTQPELSPDVRVLTFELQETLVLLGNPPDRRRYMPIWTDTEADHLMMYEDTTEGTPISPAFKTPEELANWLVLNNGSAFAGMTASYDAWLSMIRRQWAPSAVLADGKLLSGVEGFKP